MSFCRYLIIGNWFCYHKYSDNIFKIIDVREFLCKYSGGGVISRKNYRYLW